MSLFTLHHGPKEFRIVSARVGKTPSQVARNWGGEFVPRPGGMPRSSSDPDELGVCGVVRFPPDLFREMDDTDIALAGTLPGNVVYTQGGIALLANRGETVELTLRQTSLAVKEAHVNRLPRLSQKQAACYDQLRLFQRRQPEASFTMHVLCGQICTLVNNRAHMIYRLRDKGLVVRVTRSHLDPRWKVVAHDFINPDGTTVTVTPW